MKTTQIILGLLLLSCSTFGQTIIPQKSDSTDQKPKLQYFGDEKQEEVLPVVEGEKEVPIRVDTVTTQPVIIKYYQDTESYREKEVEEEPKQNKHRIKTLTGKMNHSGGYGAVSFKATDFKDKTLVMAGVRGAWVVNRTLAIGIDADGIIPTAVYADIDPDDMSKKIRLQGGYGGFMLEPIFFSNEVVHITFPISAGAGWLGYEDPDEEHFWGDGDSDYFIDDDVFWYIEPGANLEVNIAHNFRLDLGVSKRFTQDLQLVNTDSDEFDQINYYLTLNIGGF